MAFDILIASSLIIFMFIGFILISLSYLIYILVYVITQTRKLKENNEFTKCSCGGANQLYLKDILMQFWFVSVFIYVIVHIIFQFAFILYDSYISDSKFPNPGNELYLIIIFLMIFIVAGTIFAVMRRKKRFRWEHHKSPKAFIQTFQVFYIAISGLLIANIFISTLPLNYNHLLLYEIFNKLSLIYPAFFLNAIFFVFLKKFFENHKISIVNQILIGFIFMILPFFLWMLVLLFIQNIWAFINYGILSGFVLGFLFAIGIDNIMTLFNKREKLEVKYRVLVIFIITILTYLRIYFSFPIINIIFSFIFIIISYIGLHIEFFLHGDKTQYIGNSCKKDYTYYIFIGFIFLLFLCSLETVFATTNLIVNPIFVQHTVLKFLFEYSLVVGMMVPILILIIKNNKEKGDL